LTSSLLLLALANSRPAAAAEVVWDGWYRARGIYTNSLSLASEEESPNSEGAAFVVDHRLNLRPRFLLSDKAAVHLELDFLRLVPWGTQAVAPTDINTGDLGPEVYAEQVSSPTTGDGGLTDQSIRVNRVWGEVDTGVGILRVGRVPLHWGTGMVFNAGLDPNAEYGDTADRVQFTGKVGEVFLMGAWESRLEGLVNERDDYRALVGAVYYQTETVGLGTLQTYRWRGGEETPWSTWIPDLWARAELGPVEGELEFAGVIGKGSPSESINDIRLSAWGGNLGASAELNKLRFGAGLGFATGDNEDDSTYKTFTFDPDFNRTVLLFEEPMPTVEPEVINESNEGRSREVARVGEGISNAIYINPRIGYRVVDSLTVDLAWFGATQAKAKDASAKGYGSEIDLDLNYKPTEHIELRGTGAVYLPGPFLTTFESDDFGDSFDSPAWGGRLIGTLKF
jgi:hypothetical protein